jgi:hypothetical protein
VPKAPLHKLSREQIAKKYLTPKIEMPVPIRSTPAVVNGVLYVATDNALYAIGKK